MKIDIEEVLSILQQNGVPAETVKAVASDLKEVVTEIQADKQKAPKSKYQYSVIVNSPTNDINNLQAWVVKMPEGEKSSELLTKIQTAAAKQNNLTRKGRKFPIKALAEAFANLERKFTKEENFQPLTKHSCQVIVSDGTL